MNKEAKETIKGITVFLVTIAGIVSCFNHVSDNSRTEYHIPPTEVAAVYKSAGYYVATIDNGVVEFERLPKLPVVIKLTDKPQYYECNGWIKTFVSDLGGQCTIYINSIDDIQPQRWKNGKFGWVENVRVDG